MGYTLIFDDESKQIEVHSDLCDVVFEKKDNFELNNKLEYLNLNLYEEVEEKLAAYDGYEVIICEICKPDENRDSLDEDYDDFYEEFAEDDEIDDTRCDIF